MRTSVPLLLTGALVLTLTLGAGPLSTVITDAMWFSSIGHAEVWRIQFGTQLGLGLGAGALALLLVGGSARLAARQGAGGRRALPPLSTVNGQPNPLGTLLAQVPAVRIADAVAVLIALLTGLTVAGWWDEGLMLANGGTFQFADPLWGIDAGFYIFDLPMILMIRSLLATLLGLAGVVALGMYVSQGVVRVQMGEENGQVVAKGMVMPADVRRHLASILAALLVVMAVGVFLRRYELMYAQTGLFAGPGHSDLYGTLPLLTLQAIATAIAAFVAFVGVNRGSVALAMSAGLLVILSSGATSIIPGLLQRFNVDPNELSKEGPQIVDHVFATRAAFGLDDIEEQSLSGQDGLTSEDIAANGPTIENVRLWDHKPLLDTFSQVQEIRTYYGFVGVDNDRYMIDGALRQIMLSPRELTVGELPAQARTWVNETMTYTHGYGVALGPVNRVNEQGLPELWVSDLPPKVVYEDDLRIDRPEIYFGEATTHPVFVNTGNPEFDYPAGDRNEYTHYAGPGGLHLGALTRALVAMRLGSTDLLFSTDVTAESRVLLYRQIKRRVKRIAPFLLLDRDPYLVIDEGRLVWVIDAYTHSSRFPYAAGLRGFGNYVRNSVKVTLDAYDGTVTLWAADASDPILAAWMATFPTLFQPVEQMSASLRAHMRYPIDLFAAQARLFATYHMVQDQVFYNREDEWEVPAIGSSQMTPYFTIMRLPGEDKEEFILMLPFSPKGKPNLAAWMVARSDGEHLGEVRVYKFPKDTMVYGPKMVVARINQDDRISEKISLWDQQGSSVDLGTLLVIPIEESLIYVQPLYLQADEDSIPELKRVIVAYEDNIAMMPTLEEGLAELFGSQAPPEAPMPVAGGEPGVPPDLIGSLVQLSQRAQQRYDAATAASRAGDWAAYGQEVEALGQLIEALVAEGDAAVAPPE